MQTQNLEVSKKETLRGKWVKVNKIQGTKLNLYNKK